MLTLYPDRNDKRIIAVKTQDVEPILEQNKEFRKQQQKSDWGRHVASVPNNIAYKWLIEAWESGNRDLRYGSREWMGLVARKLQDSEWAYLRTDK